MDELPAFLHYLENWEIPEEVADARYGVRAYQHPEIVEKLDSMNSENRLLELIDRAIFYNGCRKEVWRGSATELEQELTEDDCRYKNEAKRLLRWDSACGAFLGRLKKSKVEYVAGRVTSTLSRGRTIWTINPPPPGSESESNPPRTTMTGISSAPIQRINGGQS